MKKLITLFACLIVGACSAQLTSTKAIDFVGAATSTERDTWDVPVGTYRLFYNTTTSQLELGDENENWVAVGSGGGGSDDDITAVTFDGTNLTVTEGATSFFADISSVDTNTQLSDAQVATAVNNEFPNLDTDATDDFDGNYNSLTNLPSLFDGTWGSLTGIPSDIADGDDDTNLTQEEVEDFVGGMVSASSDGLQYTDASGALTVANSELQPDWSNIQNIPAGFADGVDNTGGAGSDGVVSNVALNGTDLEFTGADGGFNGPVSLASLQDGTGTDDQTAAEVSVADVDGNFTGTDVETVLDEIWDNSFTANTVLNGNTSQTGFADDDGTSITVNAATDQAILQGGRFSDTSRSQVAAGPDEVVFVFEGSTQYTFNNTGAVSAATDVVTKSYADANYGGGGGTDDQTASEVPITDSGANFTATDVEGALAELAASGGGSGIQSPVPGRTGTTINEAMLQTQAQFDTDGATAADELVFITDAAPMELDSDTTIEVDFFKGHDDRSNDAGTYTFSNLAIGATVEIEMDRATAPAISGITPTNTNWADDFQADTRQLFIIHVVPSGEGFIKIVTIE